MRDYEELTGAVQTHSVRLDHVENVLGQIRSEVERLTRVMSGDAQMHEPGVMARLDTLEVLTRTLLDEKRAERALLKGIVLGLGITSLTSVTTLLAVLGRLAGVS